MTSLAAAERPSFARWTTASPLDRLGGFVARSHANACAVLMLLSLACFLPGFASLHPMDRDEPRFAQASKQMLETGDFVDIRFQADARHKKPVGIYWLQSAAVAAGDALGVADARATIALYRLPSLFGALATVLLTYWAALALVSRREAFLASSFMAASIILMVEAHLAKTDAVLTACSVAAMGALARAYVARGRGGALPTATALLFWAAVGVGILVKGPLVPMFAGLCALVLSIRERSARWLMALRPGLGLILTLLIVAPWFIAIALKSGGAFFQASVGDDMLGKVGAGQQNHWGPPGYYVFTFFATFWPAAALAVLAAPFAWLHRREDAVAFALAWAIPSWLVFEAVSTKLPHYVMPLYPALAIVTAAALARGFVGPHRPGAKAVALLIPFIPLGLTLAILTGAWLLDQTVPHAGALLLVAASATAVWAWRLFAKGDAWGAALVSTAASALLAIGVLGLTQPLLRSLKLSPRMADVARTLDCPDASVGTLGYYEPSLVFLAGTRLQMLHSGLDAARFMAGGSCRLTFVERRHEDGFRAELDRLNLQPALAARIAGFNINGGRRVDIGAYVAKP